MGVMMLTRISKKKVFFRNALAKIGLAKPLYKYNFSDSCPKGIVQDFSTDGMLGRLDARCVIQDALKDASIPHIYYSVDRVLTNTSTLDRHLQIWPDDAWGRELKKMTGLRKLFFSFGGILMGFDYYLYFEDLCELSAFQIVR
jgi:hypothetical protein